METKIYNWDEYIKQILRETNPTTLYEMLEKGYHTYPSTKPLTVTTEVMGKKIHIYMDENRHEQKWEFITILDVKIKRIDEIIENVELIKKWIAKKVDELENPKPDTDPQPTPEPQPVSKRTKEPPFFQQILLLELFGVMDKLKTRQGTAKAELLAFLLNKSDTTIRPKLSNLGTKNHSDNPLTNPDNPKEVVKLLESVGLVELAETAKERWGVKKE